MTLTNISILNDSFNFDRAAHFPRPFYLIPKHDCPLDVDAQLVVVSYLKSQDL